MHSRLRFVLPLFALAVLSATTALAQSPVAQTPPMGWNSWNFFADKVTDKDIRGAADQLVATGMKDAGYIYVNIDDTWEDKRDANGVLQTNAKFPNMKALADYVHSKGLKIGIYSGPGNKTCGGYTASLGHEEQDAKMYAEWGFDYLKYDLCSFIPDVMQKQAPNDKAAQMKLMIAAYEKMGKALKDATAKTGRPIVFSLCQYGWDSVWEWAPQLGGNLWRTTGDIDPHWDRIYAIASQQSGLEKYAGPGHWNDPDMLEVGNGKLTLAENRTHFSWWAMLAAPLLAGNDLPNMKPAIKAILTNKDVIAIDQDSLGKQGKHAYSDGEVEVWTRELQGGALAIAVINVGSDRLSTHPFHLDLARIGLGSEQTGKNLWTGKTVTLTNNEPIELPSHDILLVRLDHPQS
ncbi:glycoside hydrolase family 27 protein [Acidicapsa acidisoli]|uniref:glycoside hydrolase family 27 protein n=1 Tax=Acidicapsa acidisoli TaxID=1615681 RepID=UPI0021E0C39C|nr:glycoside hydrolase family 27 protein [Acidicapsa acidisoli]